MILEKSDTRLKDKPKNFKNYKENRKKKEFYWYFVLQICSRISSSSIACIMSD
jgi:hypothetical protein